MARNSEYENRVIGQRLHGNAPTETTPQSYDNQSLPPEIRRRRTVGKTLGEIAIGGIVVLAVSSIVAVVGYSNNVADALKIHSESHVAVEAPGKAEIQRIDFTMPPVTLATVDTKLSDVKVAFDKNITGLNGLINFSAYEVKFTYGADVETLVRVDPKDVDIAYDPNTDKMTFTANDATLQTSVDIPNGIDITEPPSGNGLSLPADAISAVEKALRGTIADYQKKDPSTIDLPYLTDVANGTFSVNQALQKFALLNAKVSTDQACTPLLKTIPDFTLQIKNNLKTAVKGRLLDKEFSGIVKAISDKGENVSDVVDAAEVIMPANYTIAPDEANKAELNGYLKSTYYSTSLGKAAVTCGVSKSLTLIMKDDGSKTPLTVAPVLTSVGGK